MQPAQDLVRLWSARGSCLQCLHVNTVNMISGERAYPLRASRPNRTRRGVAAATRPSRFAVAPECPHYRRAIDRCEPTTRAMRTTTALLAFSLLAAPASAQAPDTLPGEFDTGKMWTFEYAPLDYFSDTYGFTADQSWLDRIRLSVLRVPGCSASFVSPNGVVATNHHCIRGTLASDQRGGAALLHNGFWVASVGGDGRI